MKALGLDIGSSSIKGAVLDLESSVVHEPICRPFPAPVANQRPGWVEIDPSAVMVGVQQVIAQLRDQAPDAQSLLISGQMGGVILIDASARPLSNYLSWRDQRTLELDSSGHSLFDRTGQRWREVGVLRELGSELQPGSTTLLLAWLKAHGQLPEHAIPVTIGDFVAAQLVGKPVPMHVTHAIGMLDLTKDQWHSKAFSLLDLDATILPELAFNESIAGHCKLHGRELMVFGSYGDQQCALRGAGLERGELSLNVSTGSQVTRRTSKFQPGPYQSRKYFFGDTLDTVTHLPAGRSLNVLVDFLMELANEQARITDTDVLNPWIAINQRVAATRETDLKLDLAFFRGPLGERGSIENISTENLSIGTLFLAAFRSMADNYALVAERFASEPWGAVVLSGGLTHHAPRLRTLLQERFTVPLRESAGEETMLGLLDIARHSLHNYSEKT